ncbi:MAG: hypothetical protein IIA01_07260, partial [Proteobacteria bacterium]|nr:hypothetical protein [Pseudomonadota bacterium]
MGQPEKFMFDTVFSAVSGLTTRVETFGRDELDAARDEAWRGGAAEGAARERAATERLKATALETIGARLAGIAGTQTEAIDRTIGMATKLALAIARKVATESLRNQPLVEVEGVIRSCLAELIDEPRVAIRVPDALLDELKDHLDDLAAGCGYQGKVVLLADPSLEPDDCRVEWADGVAERDTGAAWRELETAIEALLHASA